MASNNIIVNTNEDESEDRSYEEVDSDLQIAA